MTGRLLFVNLGMTVVSYFLVVSFQNASEAMLTAILLIFVGLLMCFGFMETREAGERSLAYEESVSKIVKEEELATLGDTRSYTRMKGFLAGLTASSPMVVASVAAIACYFVSEDAFRTAQSAIYTLLMPYTPLYVFFPQAIPWTYLASALLYPASCALGYAAAVSYRRRLKKQTITAKKKARRINRRSAGRQ